MTRYNPYKWHFITVKQIPDWLIISFGWNHRHIEDYVSTYHGHVIEETIMRAKGKYYEYKWVVTTGGHTHDNAVIRRKLKKHKKVKNNG